MYQHTEDLQMPFDKFHFSWRKLFRFMGPGLLMSIAYMDPGNLESDLQVGAQTGYVLLWLLTTATMLGYFVQMQAAKLGVVTGKHLAEHCRIAYPRHASIVLWLMAEIAIIGSDIQEVVGSAIALYLLSGGALPLWAGVVVTAASAFMLLLLEKLGVRLLELVFAVFIGVMAVSFGVMYTHAGVPTSSVIHGLFFPSLPEFAISPAIALVGALIMPHNIYLHSALVHTRQLPGSDAAHKRDALVYFGIESALSLGLSVVINLFVVAVFAEGFYRPDGSGGGLAPDIGLQNAGEFLGKVYGPLVSVIWALGLLAAGQSSTMTGTYAGQFVMSGYLNLRVSPWMRIAITRSVAIVPTLFVAVLFRNGRQLDELTQALNLLQSVQLPFALIPVLTFTNSSAVMGSFVNHWAMTLITGGIAALVIIINMAGVYEIIIQVSEVEIYGPHLRILCSVLVAVYLAFLLYLVLLPYAQRHLRSWRIFRGPGNVFAPELQQPLLYPEELHYAGSAGIEQGSSISGTRSVAGEIDVDLPVLKPPLVEELEHEAEEERLMRHPGIFEVDEGNVERDSPA